MTSCGRRRPAGWPALIRARDVSSAEAVDACLARIAPVNPALNAVVAFAPDALEPRPRGGRGARPRRRPPGPLHGVPFTIKDSLDTAGLVTTAGTVGWRRPGAGPRRDGRRPAEGRRRDPPRQDEHAGVHLVGRDRQRRLRPDVEPVRPRRGRPAAAPAERRRSSPRAARRSTSAATPATASASRLMSAASPGSSRRSGRVPRTGHWPSFAGIVATPPAARARSLGASTTSR